ncbi:hypothetical protein EYF80_034273 [Liparis tanakae]|uniref:Uncharacterized protein n=1 Tax=Liparis tanakae TaxID=230148 RepID=A0A4Z2GQF0_9TELE|nr:hypothetical protein EYF80_034273 [Liparis tanakae]
MSADVNPNSSRTSTVCPPIAGSGARHGSAGVRERSGAGRGLSSPLWSVTKEALSWLCGCELTSSKDNTGVTQASVPSKTLDHSAWVFEAKLCVVEWRSAVQHVLPSRTVPHADATRLPRKGTDVRGSFYLRTQRYGEIEHRRQDDPQSAAEAAARKVRQQVERSVRLLAAPAQSGQKA